MADQYSGDIYLVQKNKYEANVTLYKFTPTRNSETITLRDVGKITAEPVWGLGTPNYTWPMAITGGDISRYGPKILVRNYPLLRMWERKVDQSVEDAILNNEPCELTLHDEIHGESVAIRDDDTGFLTTTDRMRHATIYLY